MARARLIPEMTGTGVKGDPRYNRAGPVATANQYPVKVRCQCEPRGAYRLVEDEDDEARCLRCGHSVR